MLEKVKEKGKKVGLKQVTIVLLKNVKSVELVAKYLKLPIDSLEKLIKEGKNK